LATSGDLAVGTAWSYDPSSRILAYQHPRNGGFTAAKFIEYIFSSLVNFSSDMEIVLDEQVLQRIEKETPNRISIKIAHPDMAKNIDGELKPIISLMQEASKSIMGNEITLAVGIKKTEGIGLSSKLPNIINQALLAYESGDMDLRSLMADTLENRDREINLINGRLKFKKNILLPKSDWNRSYEMRQNVVQCGLAANNEYFNRFRS
jgi:hypothetical protein